MAELVASVRIAAPADTVWATLVDWETHRDWMLLTDVERATDDGDGVGARIVGVTRLGPLALRDSMTVTQWQPPPTDPARCVVEHTGRIVRGCGAFEVESADDGCSRVTWSEWVRPPFGLAGAVGWLAVRPLFQLFMQVSLRRLGKKIASR